MLLFLGKSWNSSPVMVWLFHWTRAEYSTPSPLVSFWLTTPVLLSGSKSGSQTSQEKQSDFQQPFVTELWNRFPAIFSLSSNCDCDVDFQALTTRRGWAEWQPRPLLSPQHSQRRTNRGQLQPEVGVKRSINKINHLTVKVRRNLEALELDLEAQNHGSPYTALPSMTPSRFSDPQQLSIRWIRLIKSDTSE